MDGYKHYIRIDTNNIVTHGFSDAFEQPQQGDVQLDGEFGRHFQTPLTTGRGQYKYKLIDGIITERTQTELDAEWAARPPAEPSTESRLAAAEAALLALMGL
ncbi:hypothetical protein LOZ80_38100 [Paenibacillus sp. HWE-109]|uniref:hypothetical protein n=1 Tax=Paenibacillus sp. HWE-109 TaxID=1306526 RepID=UPI001EE10898|nr:hypothetical protein [Paenibacillus sp. HWE-109]UKS27206.1 hypothetical protein LOZ80_38100 [Paenibacillus sp. HWE-109]